MVKPRGGKDQGITQGMLRPGEAGASPSLKRVLHLCLGAHRATRRGSAIGGRGCSRSWRRRPTHGAASAHSTPGPPTLKPSRSRSDAQFQLDNSRENSFTVLKDNRRRRPLLPGCERPPRRRAPPALPTGGDGSSSWLPTRSRGGLRAPSRGYYQRHTRPACPSRPCAVPRGGLGARPAPSGRTHGAVGARARGEFRPSPAATVRLRLGLTPFDARTCSRGFGRADPRARRSR